MKKNCVYGAWTPVGSCDSSCKQNWKLTVTQEGENGGTACVEESRRNATTTCRGGLCPTVDCKYGTWKLDTNCTTNNGKCQKAWRISAEEPKNGGRACVPESQRTVWVDCIASKCNNQSTTSTLNTNCGPKYGNKKCTKGCCKWDGTCLSDIDICKRELQDYTHNLDYSDDNTKTTLLTYLEKMNLCGPAYSKRKCKEGCCLLNGCNTNLEYCKARYVHSDPDYSEDNIGKEIRKLYEHSNKDCGPTKGNKKCELGCCNPTTSKCQSYKPYCINEPNKYDFNYSVDPELASMASKYPYKYSQTKSPPPTYELSSTDI